MKNLAVIASLLLGFIGPAAAHELPANRATLVLRDGHASINFFIDYIRVLHQTLARETPLREFVIACAALEPAAFQSQVQEAHGRLEANTQLQAAGKPVVLTQWTWPSAASVHQQLQQQAMQALVAPNEHTHWPRAEIQAQAALDGIAKADALAVPVSVRFPPEFERVLLVSYRPTQIWVEPGDLSAVRF